MLVIILTLIYLSISEFIPLLGCTDFLACNYNASASVDDSSCIYVNISVSTLTYLVMGLQMASVSSNS